MRSRTVLSLVAVLAVVLLLCAPSAESKRPEPRTRRRIRPSADELTPLPANLVIVPPPERSSVEAVGPAIAAEPTPEVEQPQPSSSSNPSSRKDTQFTCGGTYTETDIRPLRQQWDSGNGYCGEMSLQLSAMTRGIYISQKQSRWLGVPTNPSPPHPDLLFENRAPFPNGEGWRGIYGVAKMLGLDQTPETYWGSDNMTMVNNGGKVTLSPGPSSFALWAKKNVLAGRPVIGGFRIRGGGYEDYDHIMPIFGVCYGNTATLANTDTFVLTDNYMKSLYHTPGDSSFYAGFQACGYTGCIPNDFYDYGVAVGPLRVPAGLYFPVKIVITAWSDGSKVNMEPGEYPANGVSTATASYSITITGLTAGKTYRVYRTTGLFSGFQIPQSAAALASTCTTQGYPKCNSIFVTATGPSMVLTDDSLGTAAGARPLGEFGASSITYFLVVASST